MHKRETSGVTWDPKSKPVTNLSLADEVHHLYESCQWPWGGAAPPTGLLCRCSNGSYSSPETLLHALRDRRWLAGDAAALAYPTGGLVPSPGAASTHPAGHRNDSGIDPEVCQYCYASQRSRNHRRPDPWPTPSGIILPPCAAQ